MDGVDSANAATHTVMLKKSLTFQKDMAATLIAGGTQGAPGESAMRTQAMQAQGKGQNVNATA